MNEKAQRFYCIFQIFIPKKYKIKKNYAPFIARFSHRMVLNNLSKFTLAPKIEW